MDEISLARCQYVEEARRYLRDIAALGGDLDWIESPVVGFEVPMRLREAGTK